jgi:cyclophilin family peptidyl-prolyl cis-trans isomerase
VLSLPVVRRAVIGIGFLLGCAGCGASSSSHSSSTTSQSSSHPPAPAAAGSCHAVSVPAPKGTQHLSPPTVKLDPRRTYTVTVHTNCGTFAFALDVKHSPRTSASFYSLVKRGFFDGLTFHRVVAGFVIQGGDPTGTGAGGPGYTVVEPPPSNTQYVKGDVAMAKAQSQPAGASGSQFFIVTAANATQSAGLTSDYALVGRVVSGQRVVDAIGALPANPPGDGVPSPAVVMSSVTVAAS